MSKKNLLIKKALVLVITLSVLFSVSIISSASSLTMYDSTITFQHFDYTLNPDNSFNSADPSTITNTVFNTKVIENPYLKVTLLPDFGARIISIVYKPTGHELLYQNPLGTPYGIGEGSFYYDWLMVYGGIMPTFSEPEHGKYWLEPWDYQIVEQSPQKISIEMTKDDTVNFSGTPSKFNNGRTDITCKATYTVYADKPYVEMKVKLINNKNQAVNYEYWTCTTLAPGTQPGNTVGSRSMEIVAPVTKVENKANWWPWMATVDEPVDPAKHIYKFENLAFFSNWKDMGISYANDLSGNWWGVINHDNEEGILRIADNMNATTGMKIWAWGCDQSYIDPYTNYGNSARPYIELWGGNSYEFFADAVLQPYEVKEWTEYYIPTFGLKNVTNANEKAAAYLDYSISEAQIDFTAQINATSPGETMRAVLELVGDNNYQILEQNFVSGTANATVFGVSKDMNTIAAGNYDYQLKVYDSSNNIVLTAKVPVKIEGSGW